MENIDHHGSDGDLRRGSTAAVAQVVQPRLDAPVTTKPVPSRRPPAGRKRGHRVHRAHRRLCHGQAQRPVQSPPSEISPGVGNNLVLLARAVRHRPAKVSGSLGTSYTSLVTDMSQCGQGSQVFVRLWALVADRTSQDVEQPGRSRHGVRNIDPYPVIPHAPVHLGIGSPLLRCHANQVRRIPRIAPSSRLVDSGSGCPGHEHERRARSAYRRHERPRPPAGKC